MLYIALLLFILALALIWHSSRVRRSIGLPGGKIIYSDTRGWLPIQEPLYDARLGLTGRPDYLIKQGKKVIPVEVKSSRLTSGPYDSHIYQLAAYCILVERSMGQRPPYGILRYPSRTYQIDFTPALEKATLDLIGEIRSEKRKQTVHRSHSEQNRCARCGYRSQCDERLV